MKVTEDSINRGFASAILFFVAFLLGILVGFSSMRNTVNTTQGEMALSAELCNVRVDARQATISNLEATTANLTSFLVKNCGDVYQPQPITGD